jgi:hypothetical protein
LPSAAVRIRYTEGNKAKQFNAMTRFFGSVTMQNLFLRALIDEVGYFCLKLKINPRVCAA